MTQNVDTALLAQLPISTPPLMLYASVDELRRHACVHPAAIAYYDGALHSPSLLFGTSIRFLGDPVRG